MNNRTLRISSYVIGMFSFLLFLKVLGPQSRVVLSFSFQICLHISFDVLFSILHSIGSKVYMYTLSV